MNEPLVGGIIAITAAILVAGWLFWASRASAVGCAVHGTVLLVVIAVYVGALGQPRPLWLEWPQCKDADAVKVEFGQSFEPKEIRLLVDTPCGERWWSLPFDKKQAQGLQDAQERHARLGTATMMSLHRRRSEATDDHQKPLFYANPQEAPPPKDAQ